MDQLKDKDASTGAEPQSCGVQSRAVQSCWAFAAFKKTTFKKRGTRHFTPQRAAYTLVCSLVHVQSLQCDNQGCQVGLFFQKFI